jgi:DNA-binding CsgD family transcriptional regulator
MNSNRIISGMIDKGAEFLTVDGRAMCIHDGSVLDFEKTPDHLKSILLRDMNLNPLKEKAMEAMAGTDINAKLEQFAMCQFGALNSNPDIDENGNLTYPEYVPCSKRGLCKHEGIGCSFIALSGSDFLSRAETAVLRLVEFENEIIADNLFLSVETVKKHFQNIRRKTGKQNKIELAVWAVMRGII